MKLPKIPKNLQMTRIVIRPNTVRFDLDRYDEGLYLTGSMETDESIPLTCSDRLKQVDEETILESVTLSGGLVPFAKDIESIHVRITKDGREIIVRMNHGGFLTLPELYPDILFRVSTKKI